MKGGIAGMLFALETLRRLGVRLAGDVVFCTDTDEEQVAPGSAPASARRARRRRAVRRADGFDAGSPAAGA